MLPYLSSCGNAFLEFSLGSCIDSHNGMRLQLSVSQILSQGQHIPMRQRRVLQSEAFSRNYDKMKSTFRLLVRDWAAEGKDERSQCYAPIIEEVQSLFSERSLKEKNGTRILCPGCGLGRLPWELARKGFACQGNEFSFQMLLTSNYILNSSLKPEMFTIYPYIHTSSNHVTRANQLRTVTVPDVVINDPSLCEDFSMAAGEFVEVYGGEINSWDCVTTCFFLDTAHSPFEYVRIIYDILKPGGYWVNLGPLLYHYEESPNERSVELAFDEVTICIHFYRSLQCIVSISIRDLLPFSLWVLLRSSGHGANC